MTNDTDRTAEFDLLPELADHSRVTLGVTHTPLERLERLGEKLGIELFVKRDDTQPLAMGGNKVRQLEYYLGPARDQGADTVLITGAVQSNFVRLCAAAARKLGWLPVVQLEDRVPKDDETYRRSGNVLIDHLLGAEIHTFPEGENEAAADANLDEIGEKHREAGRKPYIIHLGTDHPPLGGLGYALCAVETYLQLEALGEMPDHVVLASGSGLTHAGFLTGARAIGWDVPVHGICVRRDASQQHPRIFKRAQELDAMLGGKAAIGESDVLVDDTTFPPGYGRLNDAVRRAMHDAAVSEALLLDPVYTGRAMAGLCAEIQSGKIMQGDKVVFIHTGGLPALFAYQDELMTGR